MTTSKSVRNRVVNLAKHKNACLGACIYLSANELIQLGIEVDNTESIQYYIDQSGLVVVTDS